MKKCLSKILIFVLPAWLLLLVVDYWFSQEAKQSNDYVIEAWYDLMNGDINADVIVMGSSRAWVHIDPLILDSILGVNTYNLGIDGRSFNSQIKKYHIYREHNNKPKLIIQNIDAFSLNYLVGYKMCQFFPYFWDETVRREFVNTEPFTAGEKYLPMYRYIHTFYQRDYGMYTFLQRNNKRTLTKGYLGQLKTWDGQALNEIDSVSFPVDGRVAQMFEDYLEEVTADSINIIFVYSPIYIGAVKKMTSLDQMYEKYQEYSKKYNIPILDYTFMKISYDTSYFYNAMHLNKLGSQIYSDSLANDINRLNILNK